MPVSKKRKKFSASQSVRSRQKKALYLPLAQDDANQLCLQARLAFETLRTGRGDRPAALAMCAIGLLVESITEEGHGLLPLSMVRQVREDCFDALEKGSTTGTWQLNQQFIDELARVINEYDRAMHETRLQAIVAASEKVDRILTKRAQARATLSADPQADD